MRSVLVISTAGMVSLAVLLTCRFPYPLWDETCHWPVIGELAEGRIERAVGLPMLPTYHALFALVVAFTGPDLRVARGLAVLIGALTLIVYAALLKALGRPNDTHALARLALQPLLLPFWVLVYTDVLGLLTVLLALLLHLRGRAVAESCAWVAGVLVRQSNLIWPLVAITGRLDANASAAGPPRRTARPAIIGLGIGAGIVAVDALLPSAPVENRAALNVAQLHIFLITAATLWMPVWIPHLWRSWRAVFEPRLIRPWGAAGGIAAAGVLLVVFQNPHAWNVGLEYLRNWPLVLFMREPYMLLPAGLVLVLFVAAHAHYVWTGPARRQLVAIAAVSALYIAPHALIDPRYYIIPIVLADLFTPYSPRESRRLTAWYALLAAGVAAWLLFRPGSGMI